MGGHSSTPRFCLSIQERDISTVGKRSVQVLALVLAHDGPARHRRADSDRGRGEFSDWR